MMFKGIRWVGLSIILIMASCTPPQKKLEAPTLQAPPSVAPIISEAADLRPRLERLREALESQRQELHIPGMAIAVIKDDAIILAQGFGAADLEREIPVSQETLFSVGSTTKAFTSALVGMVADEGSIDWDDPVTKHLPFLRMNVGDGGEGVTIRDMLCHRTGFARMGLLWAGGATTREEILRDSVKAEPYADFRQRFYYNNVMYLGAGEASARASGAEWDSLLAAKILQPLGMNHTTVDYATLKTNAYLAKGYAWDEDLESYRRLPMRNLENIAPAGAIVSNVMDMARWVRFQLGQGVFEGKRLISESSLSETWRPQIKIADGIDYGLGWFVREWNGKRLIEHGGNIDGFAAQVAFLPEDGVGFVLLANVTASPLQQSSINLVFDHILGEEKETATAGDQDPHADYIGEYIANFATFRDATMTVLSKDGKLAVDVPGQTVYELKDPDEHGKWLFALTDTIAVSFERDEAGKVVMMRMHQAGFDFEVPRKGAVFEPEIDPAELKKFEGKYFSQNMNQELTVLIQHQRLAVDVPGQMVFELTPPDEAGHRSFRIRKEMAVVFNSEKDGRIGSMTYYKAGTEVETLSRVLTEGAKLPSIEEILALRRSDEVGEIIKGLGLYRMKGNVRFAQAGIEGTVEVWMSGADHFRQKIDIGKYGFMQTAVSPERASVDSTFNPFEEQRGKYLAQAQLDHPAAVFGDLRAFYDKLEVLRPSDLDGRPVYVLSARRGALPAATLYLDAETGDLLKQESVVVQATLGGFPVKIAFEDYREQHGLRIPFRIVSQNEQTGKNILVYDALEIDLKGPEGLFVLEDPDK